MKMDFRRIISFRWKFIEI